MTIQSTSLVALMAGAALLFPVAAQAADLLMAPPAVSYEQDVVGYNDTWSGFYLGANLGGVTSDDFDEANSAVIGGVQAGYLQQFGLFVLGAEVEGNYSDNLEFALAPGAGLSQEWSVTAKARAGVSLGQTLLYGTLGGTAAELKPTGATTSDAETHVGLAFGAGVEQAITSNISLRAEYQQTQYYDVESTVGGLGRTDDLTTHALKAGVNFRF